MPPKPSIKAELSSPPVEWIGEAGASSMRPRFTVRPRNFAFPPGVNTDKTEAMLEFLEGPLHK
jgi:hypothetical protein